jgi:uncharacterized membrane protein YsdA (DUF1294 family)
MSQNSNGGAGGRITVMSVLVLAGLLALPALALYRQAANLRWIGGGVAVMSALAYWAYARDKRRAREQAWRLPEARLHLLELLGGWPGAWLAQRWLRHKCSKLSYQCVFWIIVLAYQFAAFDSLQDWKFSRAAKDRVEQALSHRR